MITLLPGRRGAGASRFLAKWRRFATVRVNRYTMVCGQFHVRLRHCGYKDTAGPAVAPPPAGPTGPYLGMAATLPWPVTRLWLVAHNPGQEATDRRDALQENARARAAPMGHESLLLTQY